VAGTLTSFSASGTIPGGSVSQYQWTFGDGRTTNQGGADTSTVFPCAGIYPVTLTATASNGTSVTRVTDVDVVAASSAVTSIPSNAVWYSTTPVAQYLFLPTPTGGLAAESSDGAAGQGWLRQGLPGQRGGGLAALAYPDPAVGDAITPHAYYRSASGTLAETYLGGSGWATKTVGGWQSTSISSPDGVAANSPLSAVSTSATQAGVFFVDGQGKLAEANQAGQGWGVHELPGTTGSTALAATSHLISSGLLGPEVFWLAHGGQCLPRPAGRALPRRRCHAATGR
jgi:PKD repeat protein